MLATPRPPMACAQPPAAYVLCVRRGLLLETDRVVLTSIGKAIDQLGRLEPHIVFEALHAMNLKLQEDVVTTLSQVFALRGAKNIADCEANWDSAALLPFFAAEEVKTLVKVPNNSETFANSLDWATQRYQSLSDEKRVELTLEVRERLHLAALRLRDNCRLINSALDSIIPFLSSYGIKSTKTGFKKFRKIPLLERRRRQGLSLDRAFLAQISLSGRFINTVSFNQSVLFGASFKDSIVQDTDFSDAYLRAADFSGALLKSSRLGKTIWGGWRSIYPTSFHSAQVQEVDFREQSSSRLQCIVQT